jgi:hypothetical protein
VTYTDLVARWAQRDARYRQRGGLSDEELHAVLAWRQAEAERLLTNAPAKAVAKRELRTWPATFRWQEA